VHAVIAFGAPRVGHHDGGDELGLAIDGHSDEDAKCLSGGASSRSVVSAETPRTEKALIANRRRSEAAPRSTLRRTTAVCAVWHWFTRSTTEVNWSVACWSERFHLHPRHPRRVTRFAGC
jgi:hypothetical protein